MVRSKLNQNRKDHDVKFARNKGVQDEERTMMEKAEKCNSSGDGKDEMESLQNKVALLETKIDELQEKERISREKQGKAAKVTAQLEQEVKSMREVLKRSFTVAPKDPGLAPTKRIRRATAWTTVEDGLTQVTKKPNGALRNRRTNGAMCRKCILPFGLAFTYLPCSLGKYDSITSVYNSPMPSPTHRHFALSPLQP